MADAVPGIAQRERRRVKTYPSTAKNNEPVRRSSTKHVLSGMRREFRQPSAARSVMSVGGYQQT